MLKAILDGVPSLSAPAFIWRDKLGEERFAQLQKHWLKPTEGRPKSHSCRKCKSVHRIHWHSDDDAVSIPPKSSYCEKRALSFEDVCLLRFDLHIFIEKLCDQLSIAPDKCANFSAFPCRIGWLQGAERQYPVYLLLGEPSACEQAAKNLLVEEESPFALFSSSDLPELFPLFKKKKCALLSLFRIAGITTSCVETVMTGAELFEGFLRDAEESVYRPVAGVKILDDYARIVFPDGHIVHLARATVRRSVVRFIHQWVKHKNDPVFDIDIVRAAYDEKHPDLPWTSRRFIEDLFKRHEDDFDHLFHSFPGSNRRYRLKI